MDSYSTPSSSNGLFDIAEIAESLSAARDSNEPSLKKQRQDYNLALPVHITSQDINEEKKLTASNPEIQQVQGGTLESLNETSPIPVIGHVAAQTEQITSSEPKQQLQLPFRKRHLLSSNPSSDPVVDNPISPPLQDTEPHVANGDVNRPSITTGSPRIPTKLMDLYLPPRRTKKPATLGAIDSNPPASSKPTSKGKGTGRRRKSKGAENGDNSTSLYCICQQPYDPTLDAFMICCDACDEWYHGSCVGITQKESKKIVKYVCPKCISAGNGGLPVKDAEHKKKSVDTTIVKPTPSSKAVHSSTDRKCAHQPCNNLAKPGSKYCSDSCSMSVAREAIKKKQDTESTGIESVNVEASAADAADLDALEEIARRKAEIEAKLHTLEKEQQELEKAIQSIVKRNAKDISENSVPSPSGGIDSPQPGGSPIASPASPLSPAGDSHEERQKEGSMLAKVLTNNKRKKSRPQGYEVCGCPTSESPDGYCNLLRTNCVKHVNWEEMKRATLEHEKTQHKTEKGGFSAILISPQKRALDTIAADEMRVRNRMARRKESANNTHRTIVEA